MPKINPRAASSLQARDDSSIRPESMSQASNQGAKSIIHGETPQPAQARRTVWIGSGRRVKRTGVAVDRAPPSQRPRS
jgi:hypothetical protein